jgi:hypothetical protein
MTWTASRLLEAGDLAAAARAYLAILKTFPDDPVAKLVLKDCEKSL